MRKIAIVASLVMASLSVGVAPAGATHNPCDPAGPVCLRVACPPPATGNGWVWIDHHGIPGADFTHCAAA